MSGNETAPPTVRRYQCPACGHQMTYGDKRCDACAEEAPVYNLPNFWRGLTAVLLAAALFALWVWMR